MWKKEEIVPDHPTPRPERPTPQPNIPMNSPEPGQRATVGRSIVFRGDLSGEEDLVIQGRVEGSVNLGQHSVTIGPDGEVIASVAGRVVTVEGRVEGNIDGSEQVTLKSSSHVKGDITAPRVVLENGARFRGLVDMGDDEDQGGTWARPAASSQGATSGANGKARQDGQSGSARGSEATSGAHLPGSAATDGSDKSRKSADVGAQITA